METIILPTLAFILLGLIAYGLSRGLVSLPTICFVYLTFVYLGCLRLWFQSGSDTYLYVLAAAGAFIAGTVITHNTLLSRSRRFASKRRRFDIGLRRVGKKRVFRSHRRVSRQVKLAIGLHPQVLLYTLTILTMISFSLWVYWLWAVGSPLFSGNPSVGWVESGAGAMHRLFASLGGENLAFSGVGWYALSKARPQKRRGFLAIAVCCIAGAAMFMALQGSKGAAIMTLLWFAMAFFYFNRRSPKLRILVVMALLAIPLTWWITSYYVYLPGQSPISIIYNRATTVEASGLNFLVQTWVPRYGPLHGRTFSMDISRIKAQFLGGFRPVLFHEYIWNLMNGVNPYVSHRLSEDLTLFGVGYANFGLLGGCLFMFLFGGVCEALDAYLMTAKKMHFLIFAVSMYLISSLIAILMSGDILVIGLETFLITIIPKLCSFFAVYELWALPFRIPLDWSNNSRKSRVPQGPQTFPKGVESNCFVQPQGDIFLGKPSRKI